MVITLRKQVPLTGPAHTERCHKLIALDHYREPLAGVTVEVRLLDGSGTFDGARPGQASLELVTDEAGEAFFDWSEADTADAPGRSPAELQVSCMDERAIDLVLEEHLRVEMPWI